MFERKLEVSLAPHATQAMLQQGKTISEGEFIDDDFLGSTMVTVNLQQTAGLFSDPPTEATAKRVAQLYLHQVEARQAARTLAMHAANRAVDEALTDYKIDVKTNAKGAVVFISADVEAKRSKVMP